MQNEEMFRDFIKQVRPDLFVLMDLMDKYHLNEYVLLKFIRHIVNIGEGTGWGRIQVFIKEGKVQTIESIESDNVDETITRMTQDDKANGGRIQKNTAEDHYSPRKMK